MCDYWMLRFADLWLNISSKIAIENSVSSLDIQLFLVHKLLRINTYW